MKRTRKLARFAALGVFGFCAALPLTALAQQPGPPPPAAGKIRPYEDSIKRRERLLGLKKARLGGAGAPALGKPGIQPGMQPKALTPGLVPPPPPPLRSPGGQAASQTEEDKSKPKDERHFSPWPRWRRGRIDFDKADIRDVAKFISEITGKNIILSDKARAGKLTIFSPSSVTKAEAYRAFLAALEVNNLTVVESGKFLKIVPQRDAKEMPGGLYNDPARPPNDDQMVTAILRVKNGDAKEINNIVGQLKNKNGFNLVYAPTNAIIVSDVAANVRRLMRIIKLLDVPVGTRERVWVVKIEHATASELVDKLNQIFGEKAGTPARPGAPQPLPHPPMPPIPGQPMPTAAMVAGETIELDQLRVSKMISDDRTNQIIFVSTEPVYLRLLALIARLDVKLAHDEGKVHVYYLQNGDAEALAGVLSGLVTGAAGGVRRTPTTPSRPTPGPGGRPGAPAPTSSSMGTTASGVLFEGEVKISADKATNSLVIVASVKDFERLKKVIAKLDIRRRQVFVEAVIMELSMTKTRDLGLAFNAGTAVNVSGNQVPIFGGTTFGKLSSIVLDPTVLTGLAVGVRGPPIEGSSGLLGGLPGSTSPTSGTGIGISLPSFGVILRALQSTSDVNVLSTPTLLASDNEEAEILVGQNVPFITGGGYGGFPGLGALAGAAGAIPGAASALGGLGGLGGIGIGGFPNIQRQDVALTLKVTPQINESDFIKLKVDEEVNDLAGDDPLRGPTTTKRKAKTTVIVKDQQTVVIGGLIRDNYSEDINKVPVLGDVPIIGYFFRDTVKRIEKRNLLLFLTPYIIKDPSDFRRIFKQKMRERQEFLERFASETKEYRANIDYAKRHGLLEEINQQVQIVERKEAEEAKQLEEEKKKAARAKDLEFVRGEEIKPHPPEKRKNFDPDKKRPPVEEAGIQPASSEKKADPKKKPERGSKPPSARDEEGVRDE
jgi:general secretion pathway protein D